MINYLKHLNDLVSVPPLCIKFNPCFLLLICLWLSHLSYAQPSKLDSLLTLLPSVKDSKIKVDVLTDIAYKYLAIYPDSSLYYITQAENLTKKIKDQAREALIINHKALAYYDKGNLAQTLHYLKESLGLAQKIKNQNLIARNLGNLGLVYLSTGNNALAIQYYQEALVIFEKLNNLERTALTLSNIGNAYIELQQYDSAESYVTKALPLAQKYAPLFESYAWFNAGKIKLHHKDLIAAEKDAQKALVLAQKSGDKLDLVAAYILLADIYLTKNQLDKALEYAEASIKIAESSQRKYDIYASYEMYSKLLATKQDFKTAFKYRDLSVIYKDSLEIETMNNALQVYEYEKKQGEIAVLKAQQAQKDSEYERRISQQRNLLYLAMLALGFMLVLLGIIALSRRKIKKVNEILHIAHREIKEKQEEILSQNEELRHQQEEINNLNNHLEDLVKEKTATILQRNAQLNDYAHFNAHKLRAPIATILGLYQILKLNPSPEEKAFILEKMEIAVIRLDEMVKKSQQLLDDIED